MKKAIPSLLGLLFFLYSGTTAIGQSSSGQLNLIPYPKQMDVQQSSSAFNAQKLLYYTTDSKLFGDAEQYLKQHIFTGNQWNKSAQKNANIQLIRDNNIVPEGYNLNIDEKGIQIKASTQAGAFYALQTLKQMSALSESSISKTFPYIKIKDAPTYQWRGVELDVARHFFSKDYLFKFIDLLALYKFNKLHLHLTDDQGWRIEIKRYPKLTQEGAWRSYNNQDSACFVKAKDNPDFNLPKEHIRIKDGKEEYGGYYTQDDIREIIKYAATRSVEIIPEIDMPGHMMIATKAYPELLLDGASSGWGTQFSVPICPCKESAYTFTQNVLQEVIDLFPSKYIHIGADEVEKTSWKASPLCQQLMKEEGIAHLEDLQSYFVGRINTFIRKNNKVAIGWDEILEGKSDPSMTVMYWRGWVKDAPQKAIERNHPVIMTPTNPLYFDYLPNKSSLESVYKLNVVPADIPADKISLIQGAQANIWTEMIPSKERLEFMILPRLSALAERVWTDTTLFESYEKRLINHYGIWNTMQLNYRLPDLTGFSEEQVIVDGTSVLRVDNPLPGAQVHYTLDGAVPAKDSPVLNNELKVTTPGKVRFATVAANGAKSEIYTVNFKKDDWKQAAEVKPEELKQGLTADFFAGTFPTSQKMTGNIVRTEVLANVHISDTVKMASFGTKIRGYIRVPKQAVYNFYLTCDDGGILKIDNQLVIDNDGQHSAVVKSGQIALKEGFHAFAIDFIEAGGGFTLKLDYSEDGGEVKPVPDKWFYH